MSHDATYSNSKRAVILDTGALLAKYYRLLPRNTLEVYTTESAVREVIDKENREALEEAITLELIKVFNPTKSFIEQTIEKARECGVLHKLSKTDIEVAALALELRSQKLQVIVITDDYDLQNLLLYIGIGVKPLRTRGITQLRITKAKCRTCGYVPSNPEETICPLCGDKIVSTHP